MSIVLFFTLLTAAVFGIPVPEDVAMLTIAIQVKRGVLSFPIAFGVCWVVLVFADSLQFMLGKFFGKRILDFLKKRGLLKDERRATIERRLSRWGIFACFVARFIPGGRVPVFVLAGNI
ncbi:MAG: VTT domain-containing protein, partial [Sphingobacteriia bacterium]|nr:VTT domain-containing protein [Sphingobacteriia bacterium]